MKKKKNVSLFFRFFFVLIGFLGCFVVLRCANPVRSEAQVSPAVSPTPTFYQVKFNVVLVGEVLPEEEIFYVDLEVVEDPRKYLRAGELMSFEMPKRVYFKYKKLQGSNIYLWCEEFFYVDITCDIYDYTKEE